MPPSDISVRLRQMSAADVGSVVQVHLASFPRFFLSSLGPEFLRILYRAFLEDAAGIAAVAEQNHTVVGFVCGSSRPRSFYSRLFKRHWWRFGLAAASALVGRPSRIVHLLGALRRRLDSKAGAKALHAELMSLAVCPGAQSRGIGRSLVLRFVALVRDAEVHSIMLTTDRAANEGVNRFYNRMGFTLTKSFVTNIGREMNEYEMAIDTRLNGSSREPEPLESEVPVRR
jgi:ribosomal protein S18 acetylase RimI-like enzyme